ncbi:DNA-dependent metalloprotease SPRTN [Pseudochaenichthys georgianus]|uniref:DNA-dependent metalloprotease SPRTN n=1 Tax=Pseudochaenichthys georgianus TaxID=52239 RepID=UPI00146CE74E|nr:sprT-like domain-containing protein Spartan [Pseudochaenichthys georgianus]
MDEDFMLALRLQEQFDNEYETPSYPSSASDDEGFGQSSKKRKVEVSVGDVVPYWKPKVQPDRPLSIVDSSWETLDPSPDVRAMFLEFNDTFFWGKLSGVEVKWSPRMTLCAGVCSYEGRGGLCSIRLSAPLLKLRPRKDLVQTLLHEMIHALLFVTQNNRDRDGHGPEFCKHMNRINDATGTQISVYHSFHGEVDVYRQHWWKCNGPCQNRKPYFGFVKRALNRAPSSQDPWWEEHRRTCGGTYTKVKEPEGYGKKGKKGDKKEGKTDEKTSEKKASGNEKPPSTTTVSVSQDIRNLIPFSGKGFQLGGNPQPSPVVPPSPKKLFPPSSPAKSPVPSIRPASSMVQKPLKRKSVGNTRAFVNINGSPVRISRPRSNRSQDADKNTQRSIEGLFTSTSLRRSTGQSSNPETKRNPPNAAFSASGAIPKQLQNDLTSTASPSEPSHSVVSTGTKGSPGKPSQSKYFSPTNSVGKSEASGSAPTSRKRPWNERGNSPSLYDFFQRALGSDSAAPRELGKTQAPAMQQRTATSSASSSTSSLPGMLTFTPSSSSSSALMVSCPVCQTQMPESDINQHLDSCLS